MKHIDIIVKEHEEKIFPYFWFNGDEKEVTLKAELVGDGATLQIIGIFIGTQNNSVVFNTHVTHKGKKTKSITHLRGVFKDRSSFKNDGMVYIKKGAKGADGYFTSKILLFDDAKGISIPSLEIDENDLKAGHASSIGRPDEEQMFYLRSRGLSEKDAEKLVIQGFFSPLISSLKTNDKVYVKKKLSSYADMK